MSDDCEIPEFYSYKEPVARKQHKCCECRSPIEKGEKHFFVSMKYEGDISTERQHLVCMSACMAARDYQDECVYYGGLKEWYSSDPWLMRSEKHGDLKEFRGLYAQILRRERAAKEEKKC